MTKYVTKKPFGIATCMSILGFIGSVGTFVALGILAISVFGDGPYRMNGEVVGKAEFLRFAIPFTAVYIVVCLVALFAAWSIHSEHPRSRSLLLAFAALPLAGSPFLMLLDYPLSALASPFTTSVILVLVAWLYLFRKRSVLQYYTSLANRDRPRE